MTYRASGKPQACRRAETAISTKGLHDGEGPIRLTCKLLGIVDNAAHLLVLMAESEFDMWPSRCLRDRFNLLLHVRVIDA